MKNTIHPTPTIPLAGFVREARQLRDDQSLRLNKKGTALASSNWQRFKVLIGDIFLSKEAIAEQKSEARNAFLLAVRTECGPQLDALASSLFHQGEGSRPLPLKARLVKAAHTLLEQKGGSNWLANEHSIQRATHAGCAPSNATQTSSAADIAIELDDFSDTPTLYTPTLDTLTEAACSKLRAEAEKMRAESPEQDAPQMDALLEKCISTALSPTADGTPPAPLSSAIGLALRDASCVRAANGDLLTFRRLEREEIQSIGEQAIKTYITRQFNASIRADVERGTPFIDTLNKQADTQGLHDHLAVFTEPQTLKQTRELETYAIHESTRLLTPGDMKKLRESVINAYLDRQHEKLEHIGQFKLADSPAKTRLINSCMGVRSAMDANYFAQVQAAASAISTLAKTLPAFDPHTKASALLTTGADLIECFRKSASGFQGADDISQFMTLSADLLDAQSTDNLIDSFTTWAQSDEAKTIQEALFNQVADPQGAEESRQMASQAAFLITSVASLTDRAPPGPEET